LTQCFQSYTNTVIVIALLSQKLLMYLVNYLIGHYTCMYVTVRCSVVWVGLLLLDIYMVNVKYVLNICSDNMHAGSDVIVGLNLIYYNDCVVIV
jgi:hypothetical protein